MSLKYTKESKIKDIFKKECILLFKKKGIQYTSEELEKAANIFYEEYKSRSANVKNTDLDIAHNNEIINQMRNIKK